MIAVRCERVSEGVVVKILTTGALQNVETVRDGETAVVTLPAKLPPVPLELPPPLPPLRSMAFESGSRDARLRLAWAPGATLESSVGGSLLTLLLRTQDQPPASRDVEGLYAMLFPQASDEPTTPTPSAAESVGPEPPLEGFALGPFQVKPSFASRYVDTSATLVETPEPVAARYLEIQPALSLGTRSLPDQARFSLAYEPRIRLSRQHIPSLSEPSHALSGSLEFPIGSSLRVSFSDRWHRATLETEIVDPGREYFYDLARYRRNEIAMALQTTTPGRLDWDLAASRATETVAPGSAYFSNVREMVSFGPRYEVGAASYLTLRYELERIPPPAVRPIVESHAQSLVLGFDGEIGTSLRASMNAGYRSQRHPRAVAPGSRFEGITLSAALKRDFANGGQLALGGGRTPYPSAFEANAFYVANGVNGSLVLPAFAGFWLSLAVRQQWNDYRVRATGLAVPRDDSLFGWSAGLARHVTRFASLRVDYHQDRRESNIPGLSNAVGKKNGGALAGPAVPFLFSLFCGLSSSGLGFRVAAMTALQLFLAQQAVLVLVDLAEALGQFRHVGLHLVERKLTVAVGIGRLEVFIEGFAHLTAARLPRLARFLLGDIAVLVEVQLVEPFIGALGGGSIGFVT